MVDTEEREKTGLNRHPISGRFLPGNKANPLGRPPKDQCLMSIMKEEALREREYSRRGKVYKKPRLLRVIEKCFELAEGGDIYAIREILKYNLMLPAQRHELTGAEGEPIEVIEKIKDRGMAIISSDLPLLTGGPRVN